MSSKEDNNDVSFDMLKPDTSINMIKKDSMRSNIKERLHIRKNSESRESKRFRALSQIFSEVHPLLSIAASNSSDDKNTQQEIIKLLEQQKQLIDTVSMTWGLDDHSVGDRVVMSNISSTIANTMKDKNIEGLVLAASKTISEIHRDRLIFGDLIEDDLISTDVIVNIKAALLNVSILLYDLFSGLEFSREQSDIYFREFHRLVYSLTKDIAFNWDKEANVEDRESLFINTLSYSGMIVFNNIKRNILNKSNLSSIVLDEYLIWTWIPDLKKELLSNDMGYLTHAEFNMDWLQDKIGKMLVESLKEINISSFNDSEMMIYRINLLNKYEIMMINAWKEISENKIKEIEEKLDNLDDKEKETLFASDEFNKPMEIYPVINLFQSKLNKMKNEIFIDFDKIITESSKDFALFWGLSDAICRMRKI